MKHIVLLFGEDSFGIQEKLNSWKTAFIQKYGGDINLDEIEGKTEPTEIVAAAQTMPFLSEKRLVIVKDIFKEQDKEALKTLSELLKDVPESCTLIFVETSPPDKRTTLYKTLEKNARLEECKPLMGQRLIQWIQTKAEEFGSTIDSPTAEYLASHVGHDQWRLHNEIQKCALYATPGPITRQQIEEQVHGQLETSIFKLTDALGNKNAKEAIRVLHELVNRGEEVPMVFAMLARQTRLLLQILDTQRTVSSPAQIAAKIKQHPYAVQSILPQCKNFSLDDLILLHENLLAIDRGLKTGEFKYSATEQKEYLLQIEKCILQACL